ncbi:MAG: hypothetical protein F6K30_12890 [Cyanothece sp. SIO2G6]|nr:hypothetical protein [Cyanothece sp. SIO2G6]
MKDENKTELERLDPESETCFDDLAVVVSEELYARIAVGDNPSTPAGCQLISELIADAILDGFVIRQRTSPRYRWKHTE